MPNNFSDLVHPAVKGGGLSTKYAPKLTHDERCKVLALRRLGYTREILSQMFTLDPRTVARMTSTTSNVYKEVRDEWEGMGDDAFINKYVTKADIEAANKVVAARYKVEDQVVVRTAGVDEPQKRMAQKSGNQTTKAGTFCIVSWYENLPGASPTLGEDSLPGGDGWYVQLPDLFPGDYFGAFNTSGAALEYVEKEGY